MHPAQVLLTPLGTLFRNRHADESLSLSRRPELATPRALQLTSPRFADGHEIPAVHCAGFIGDNQSPALAWGDMPSGTAEMLLVMEDLDSPGARPRLHAVATFAPEPATLDDGDLNRGTSRARFLRGSRRPLSYSGPFPLPGHGPHRYRLHLYALDRPIGIDHLAGVQQLTAAAGGHVLASATLTGTRQS
jgi:phosphatidylethanolamine-binding protein (PEBP) family uncharacterized protein